MKKKQQNKIVRQSIRLRESNTDIVWSQERAKNSGYFNCVGHLQDNWETAAVIFIKLTSLTAAAINIAAEPIVLFR